MIILCREQFFFFHGNGGDEKVGHMYYSNEIWTVDQMTIFRKRPFFKKQTFGQITSRSNDHFSRKALGQMNFRSNDLSVKWSFSKKLSVKWTFGQMNFWSNDLVCNLFSVKWHFLSKKDDFLKKKSVIQPFGKMKFRSNCVRLNGDSVEWTFGQMAFGQTVFG
jgi:hypothetical protein